MATSEPFDVDELRLSGASLNGIAELVSRKPPRHRTGDKFLKGPIPWNWIQQAARLPGSALHVGVLLWFEAGCRKSRTFPISLARAGEFQLHSDTMKRCLWKLEAAKLVSIRRPPGRSLQVTILDAPAVPNAADP